MTTVAPLPAHLTQHGSDPQLLGKELLDEIARSIEEHPRSQQVKIGPSEIGNPCARRIAYKLLDSPERLQPPNWKATVGTYTHGGLEDVFDKVNQRDATAERDMLGMERFLIETDVTAGVIGDEELDGHCDLYDRVTDTVVDWKTVGKTQLAKYKSKGPGEQYRIQAHTYGLGWLRKGFGVQRVAVMFLPRDGELRDSYWWTEAFDPQIALAAMQRVAGIKAVIAAQGTAGLSLLPTAEAYCLKCPYYVRGSEDLDIGCPGDAGVRTRESAPALSFAGRS